MGMLLLLILISLMQHFPEFYALWKKTIVAQYGLCNEIQGFHNWGNTLPILPLLEMSSLPSSIP